MNVVGRQTVGVHTKILIYHPSLALARSLLVCILVYLLVVPNQVVHSASPTATFGFTKWYIRSRIECLTDCYIRPEVECLTKWYIRLP